MNPLVARALTGSLLDGGLAKLTIMYIAGRPRRKRTVEALFNPTEITRSRSVSWTEVTQRWRGGNGGTASGQQFVGVGLETLSVDLLFDTFEAHSDVRELTDRVANLAAIDRELHRPPVCTLDWGLAAGLFTGVLTEVSQRLHLFLPDGRPVRATLSCTFTEFPSRSAARAAEPHSADVHKSRTVARGDTLQSLAAEEYGDAARWREIARANPGVAVRAPSPGTVLTVPKLTG